MKIDVDRWLFWLTMVAAGHSKIWCTLTEHPPIRLPQVIRRSLEEMCFDDINRPVVTAKRAVVKKEPP